MSAPPSVYVQVTVAADAGAVQENVRAVVKPAGNDRGDPVTVPAEQVTVTVTRALGAADGVTLTVPVDWDTAREGGIANANDASG